MGFLIIDQVVAALKDFGVKTQRAYPETQIPALTEVVAAVQLAKADFDERSMTVEVKLIGPQYLGAAICEELALDVAEMLRDMDLSCVVQPVEFDGRTAHFSVSCLVTKYPPKREYLESPFMIGAVNQNWVVQFTAQQETDETHTALKDAPWKVRLEQFFPNGFGEDVDPSGEVFSLTNGEEIYLNCKWTSCKRITELDGTRQIREGIGASRTKK